MLRVAITTVAVLVLSSCARPYAPQPGEIGAVPMVDPTAPPPTAPEAAPIAADPSPEPDPAPVAIDPAPAAPTEVAAAPVVEPAAAPAPEPPAAIRTPRFDVEFAGDEYRVSIDGQRVATEHLRRTDTAIEVISSSGDVLQTIAIPQPKVHPAAMIGVRFEAPGRALLKQLPGVPLHDCAIVIAVLPNGPGHAAGIEDFDLVTAVDAVPSASPAAIRKRLAELTPGDPIVLTIRRGNSTKDISVVSAPWKHVPIPMEVHPLPVAIAASPNLFALSLPLWLFLLHQQE